MIFEHLKTISVRRILVAALRQQNHCVRWCQENVNEKERYKFCLYTAYRMLTKLKHLLCDVLREFKQSLCDPHATKDIKTLLRWKGYEHLFHFVLLST